MGGQFEPDLPGQFAPDWGGQVRPDLGGHIERIFQIHYETEITLILLHSQNMKWELVAVQINF